MLLLWQDTKTGPFTSETLIEDFESSEKNHIVNKNRTELRTLIDEAEFRHARFMPLQKFSVLTRHRSLTLRLHAPRTPERDHKTKHRTQLRRRKVTGREQ